MCYTYPKAYPLEILKKKVRNGMQKFDLAVVGGGLSGVCAAVAASRRGLSVLLIEKNGALGGAINNNLVFPYMQYWTTPEGGEKKMLSAGIFSEIVELGREGFDLPRTFFMSEHLKCRLDDFVLENGVKVLFHANLCGVEKEGTMLKALRLATVSGELTVEADAFVDETGDGLLFALAGCDFTVGRESDSKCQPMTTCFRLDNVDIDLFRAQAKEIQVVWRKYKEEGKVENPREDVLMFLGVGDNTVHFNSTRVIHHDPTDPFAKTEAEMIARKQIIELIGFLKKEFTAFANATLVSIASEIGVRESRKLKGEHILTVEELKNCTRFADSIATGNYDVDIHNPDGSGTSHYFFQAGEYYTIPYRCLCPKEVDNLLVSGRCISATHEAQASVRIMPICATLGEAAGTAVAVAKQDGATVKAVDVSRVQAELRNAGACID